jgi:hypothetical protein
MKKEMINRDFENSIVSFKVIKSLNNNRWVLDQFEFSIVTFLVNKGGHISPE